MAELLPTGLRYQPTFPVLNRPVSMSQYGGRAISAIENGDPFWTWTAKIKAMTNAHRQRLEAFIDRCRGGQMTVHYTPKHVCIPQAYWGDANNPAIAGTATLGAINGNTLTLNGVAMGLKLMNGDLVGFTIGDYNFIARIVADATAASTSVQVKVEPFLPSYITVGATVRFKDPVMNMRLMPRTWEIGEGKFPDASFQLIEVPR
ncbi:hypothetical protein F9K88_07395 [Brucella intermedia]|uniref:hypothetical protein n=1 Tax=Brucella intermedia TaxID=94625 RepID=UPI000C2822BA|nr:hypothetical protein [Brucella intermedia]KAB2712776.1 hypothetical protein F9K88_07395 [Brucella intermedia]PJT22716.1 hypothetical protein CN884_12120 [Ochrobactrum sp. 30A/1000/2015]PJT37577.1 hypothetical protein CN883_16535 [Ochrobactrum sp. 27A/999/2015]PJT44183.1 hypothetical protein CN882_09845 [Ochrobactrum sp. 23A/997/2015]